MTEFEFEIKYPETKTERFEITENIGFNEEALLDFLKAVPKSNLLMQVEGLAFDKNGSPIFPTAVSPEDEKSDPELTDRAFRGRVARHTVSAGVLMTLMLDSLLENGTVKLEFKDAELHAEALTAHDLKKIDEIKLRKPFNSSDLAYDTAEEHLADFLGKSGFPEEYIALAGSVAHNAAKDFIANPEDWPILRQCAYLADDLLQETKIQEDVLAKVTRLKSDPRYKTVNEAGFPDMVAAKHPKFILEDGSPRPKYDIQTEATFLMVKNVADALNISDWRNLGKYLIVKAQKMGIYEATIN